MVKVEIPQLDIVNITEDDLRKIKGDIFLYHRIDRFLQIECKKCSNIFYQDIYYHLHGGGCLLCSLQNFLSKINPD